MVANPVCFYVNSIGTDDRMSLVKKCTEETRSTRTYLIKGAVSKSAYFLDKVVSSLEKEGLYCQKFLSFYNSNELDGAYFPDIDTYIFDSNFSSSLQSMPDCCQYTVNLGSATDKKELFLSRALIEDAKKREEKYITKAVRFISTVKTVREDTLRLSCEAVNTDKIERFVSRLIKKEFGTSSAFSGREYVRFLGAFTPDGMNFLEQTVKAMCPKLYLIDDKTGLSSHLLVTQIRESALLCGFDVISLISPFKAEKSPEHIIVPELGLGIINKNNCHSYAGDYFKKISSTRFLDSEKIKKHKTRIKFNLNAENELLNQAYFLLSEAKKSRDEYFSIYSKYTSIEKIKQIADETIKEILSSVSCT